MKGTKVKEEKVREGVKEAEGHRGDKRLQRQKEMKGVRVKWCKGSGQRG